jgi:hypothetical protein
MGRRSIAGSLVSGIRETQLDGGRMKELKKVLKFINENNPYEEEITWVTLLSYLFEEIKEGTSTIKTGLVN